MVSVTDHGRPAPGLFSVPRMATLVGSILVAICSGTGYIYSAYAPQLGARLHISHTQLNIIALGGGAGGDFTGPLWGRVVDARGPRIALIGASIALLLGYAGIKYIYDGGIGSDASIPTVTFTLIVLSHLLIGLGSCGGGVAAINMTAKSFPQSARATTTSLVASGFGLSAFCYSTIARIFFPGDTSALLLLLALGTAIPTLATLLVVRPVPLPSTQALAQNELYEIPTKEAGRFNSEENIDAGMFRESELPLLGDQPENDDDDDDISESSTIKKTFADAQSRSLADGPPDIHGKQLWMCQDSYLIVLIVTLLCGTGVMYINNVGAIAHALYANSNSNYDELEATEWQSAQVSTLSVCNFVGRVFIGLVSDFARNHLNLPRGYCLCIVSTLFIISQAVAISVTSVDTLWIATSLLGIAYGSLWGLFPTISIEWFGLEHMSENAGYLILASALPGNLFSIMFGRNLDAHTPAFEEEPLSTHATGAMEALRRLLRMRAETLERQCSIGRECYVSSLRVTLVACMAALAISTWAGIRDGRRATAKRARAVDEHGYIELGQRFVAG